MNVFTIDATNVAYEECLGHRRHKSEPVTIKELATRMDRVWVIHRDTTIGIWAERLVASCKPDRRSDRELEHLVWEVSGLLASWNTFWETPLWEPEGAQEREQLRIEQTTYVSWGISCIWWMLHEGTEIAPLLDYTNDEIETWLTDREQAESRIARTKTKSGQVVEQHLMFGQPRQGTEPGEATAQFVLLKEAAGGEP
jgi:hypothetical protein